MRETEGAGPELGTWDLCISAQKPKFSAASVISGNEVSSNGKEVVISCFTDGCGSNGGSLSLREQEGRTAVSARKRDTGLVQSGYRKRAHKQGAQGRGSNRQRFKESSCR